MYVYKNLTMFFCLFQAETIAHIKPIGSKSEQPSEQYLKERDSCLKYFDNWSENDQVFFIEHLLSRMCHYQHGQINAFLKPMLQRDFISALPGKHLVFIYNALS